MSAVKGVNRTLMDTPTPVNRLNPGLFDGRVKAIHDYYEASSLAAASTIDVGGLVPDGSYIVGIFLSYDALGAATVDVGDDSDPNRYIDAQSVASAGSTFECLPDGHGYRIGTNTDDNQLVITTASAAITGTISITIFYVHD